MSGVPGLRGVEHIAFTVPDLERAAEFLVETLGCERLYDLGPFADPDPDGTWMTDNLAVHARAVIPRFASFRCANGANFEVFEYEAPDQATRWPRMSDHGGTHIAFYVEDMDAALDDLRSKGVTVLGEGKKDGMGPEAGEGSTWAHWLAPWGQLFEFVSYPNGRAFDVMGEPRQ